MKGKTDFLAINYTQKIMITIGVIDKYPLLREWMSYTLSSQFYQSTIFEAKTVHAFLKTYPDCRPELIIMGIMPNSTVAQNKNFIKLIKSRKPSCVLVIYDENSCSPKILHYLTAGANGYLSKQNSVDELKVCIQAVLLGKRYMSEDEV